MRFPDAQLPLDTTARYWVVCVKVPGNKVVVVLLILVQVLNGDTALSHLTTVPTSPVMLSAAAVLPEHIGDAPVMVPAIVPDETVTMVESELAEAQLPLCTTARKAVVAVNGPDEYTVLVSFIIVQVVNGDTELSQRITFPV